MDTKVIVEKALKGEDYNKDIEALPTEQQDAVRLEVRKGFKDAADAEQTRLIGLRQANAAVEEKGKKKEADFDRFKEDQFSIATGKFFADPKFPVDEAKKSALLEQYKKDNSGAVDASLIFNDLKKAYASVFADDLIGLRKKVANLEKGAAQMNAGAANGAGGINSPENDKYSKEAKQIYQDWKDAGMLGKKTLADAQKMIESGSKWKNRNDLSK